MPFKKFFKKDKTASQNSLVRDMDKDFIPYVCHYNKNTLLTKNGELMKVIRITGFSDDSMMSELSCLRDNIRASMENHVKDNKFAFWFHTIRRKKDIAPKGEYGDFISNKINDAWIKKNKWSRQYVNEFYVTIITEGLDTSIVNIKSFMRSFSYFTTKRMHGAHLEEANKKLSKTVNNILADIEEYGAKPLGISQWEGVLYSEPMRFFGKIINLYEDRYPVTADDMSEVLSSHKIAFGERELEVLGDKNKHFATMMSLKEYQEIPMSSLDKILQLPFEFIITQSFDFTFSPKEITDYKYQNHILEISEDDEFRRFIGADDFSDKGEDSDTKYGKLQTTFMILAPDITHLERDVQIAIDQFGELGIVLVREDIFAEHCFWAQLPGNFKFLKRQKVIRSSKASGFAALYSFPSGLIDGNHWGPAVTVLNTILNTPYFFNFHEKDLGHSLVLGPDNSGKTIFVNFMLAQARKFNNKIIYFDNNLQSKCFINSLNGSYHHFSYDPDDQSSTCLNPLSLEKNEETREFFIDWFASLVAFTKTKIPEAEIAHIPQIVDDIFEKNITDFPSACEAFNVEETATIYKKLTIWSSGRLSHIFGAQGDVDWSDDVIAFDFSTILDQKPVLIPVVDYLLQKAEASLTEDPAIIVLSEAWNLINNTIFAPQLNEFLVRMRRKNCVVLFSSEDIETVQSSDIIYDIKKNIATEVYLPNEEPGYLYSNILGLNEEELDILQMMNREERHFLLKSRGDSIIASLDLNKLSKIRRILAADQLSLAVMDEVLASKKANLGRMPSPEEWIPQFVEVLDEIEKEQEEEKREFAREAVKAERVRIAKMEAGE